METIVSFFILGVVVGYLVERALRPKDTKAMTSKYRTRK